MNGMTLFVDGCRKVMKILNNAVCLEDIQDLRICPWIEVNDRYSSDKTPPYTVNDTEKERRNSMMDDVKHFRFTGKYTKADKLQQRIVEEDAYMVELEKQGIRPEVTYEQAGEYINKLIKERRITEASRLVSLMKLPGWECLLHKNIHKN